MIFRPVLIFTGPEIPVKQIVAIRSNLSLHSKYLPIKYIPMKCIRLFFLSVFSFCLTASTYGQDIYEHTGMGYGFQLNQYQKDFGAGLNITSPFFAHKKVAVRLRGNLLFHEHLKNQSSTWTPYANASLGFLGKVGYVGKVRLYGEGGFLSLFPSDDFSTETTHFGGYGVFGFEFFFNKSGNYFIEIGGVGTGAKADKMPENPIFSNGLIIGTGFRFYK